MISYPALTTDFEHESLEPAAVPLEADQICHALHLSQGISQPEQQWQVYLNALALGAVQTWLADRTPHLHVAPTHTPGDTRPINPMTASCLLDVGTFKLCILATGTLIDSVVSIPKATLEMFEAVPHLYVLVQVNEEQEECVVYGYLQQNSLMQHQSELLATEEEWAYEIPLSWVESDPDRLLLYLECLEPNTMMRILPQVETQPQTRVFGETQALTHLVQTATEQVINVGQWLQDQLDQTARELAWVLLPSLMPAAAMRSGNDEFTNVLQALGRGGLDIAPQARGAYHDLRWEGGAMRLYVVIWPLPAGETDAPEWALLSILGPQPGTPLPPGVGFQVYDADQMLVERTLTADSGAHYLYAQVIGTWDEQFWVTIQLPNQGAMQLPPFAFQP